MSIPCPFTTCPDCATRTNEDDTTCPECRLPLSTRAATRLAEVQSELDRLARRHRLLEEEQQELISRLRANRHSPPEPAAAPPPESEPEPEPEPAPAPVAATPASGEPTPQPEPAPSPQPSAARPKRPRREVSLPSAQNVLLGLGGLLIAIAATVFTIVTWSELGLAPRALILAGFTTAAGYTTVPLLRAGMRATAETFGVLAAALLALTTTALGMLALGAGPVAGTGPADLGVSAPRLWTAAAGTAAVATALAYFPRLVPLRGPHIIAVVLTQLVAPLAALALATGSGATWPVLLAALAFTSLGDLALYRRVTRTASRWRNRFGTLVWALGAACWFPAALPAVPVTVGFVSLPVLLNGPWPAGAGGSGTAVVVGVALAMAAAAAAWAARITPHPIWRRFLVALATAASTATLPTTLAGLYDAGGVPPWVLVASMSVSAAVACGLAGTLPLRGDRTASGLTAGAALAFGAVPAVLMLSGQGPALAAHLTAPWTGTGPGTPVPAAELSPRVVVLLAVQTAGWGLLARTLRQRWAAVVALCLATATALALFRTDLLSAHPWVGVTGAALALLGTATVAARGTTPAGRATHAWLGDASLALAGATGLLALTYALSSPQATVATAGVLLLATTATAGMPTNRPVSAATAASAALLLTGEVAALLLWFSAPATVWVVAMLAVGAVTVATASVVTALAAPEPPLPHRQDQVRALDATMAVPVAGMLIAAGALSFGALTLAAALAVFPVLVVVTHDPSLAPQVRFWASVAAALSAAGAATGTLPLLARATVDHLRHLTAPWQGNTIAPFVADQPDGPRTATALLLAVPLVVAGTVMEGRRVGIPASIVSCAGAALIGAVWLPYPATLAILTATAVAALTAASVAERGADQPLMVSGTTMLTNRAVADRRTAVTGIATAATVAVLAVSASLTGPVATITVFGSLTVAGAGVGLAHLGPRTAVAGGSATVTCASGATVAAFLHAGAPLPALVGALLSVTALAVGTAAALTRVGKRPEQVVALDSTAVLPTALALGFAAVWGRDLFALAAAVSAVLVLTVATRTAGKHTRWGLLGGGATVAASALAALADQLAAVVTGPVSVLVAPWQHENAPRALPTFADPSLPLLLPACGIAVAALAWCAAMLDSTSGQGHRLFAWGCSAAGVLVPVTLVNLNTGYGVALGALVVASGLLFAGACAARGAGAYALVATGTLTTVLASGWAATTPTATLLVLVSLTVLAAVPAGAVRAHTPAAVARVLAYLAGVGTGLVTLSCYGALLHAGFALDPRWHPFAGLATAALITGLVRLRALSDRPAQRGGLVTAGVTLLVVSSFAAPGAPGLISLVAAVCGLLLLTFAHVLPTLPRRLATVTAALVAAGALTQVLVPLVSLLLAPYVWVSTVWQPAGWDAVTRPATVALAPIGDGDSPVVSPPVGLLPTMATVAATVLLGVRLWARSWLPRTAALLAVPVLVPFPLAVRLGNADGLGVAGLPYPAALAGVLLVAAVLTVLGARSGNDRLAAVCGGAALAPLTLATAWGLTTPLATLVTLAAATVLAAVAAALARTVVFAAGATATAVLAAGGFALAIPLALGQPAEVAALAPLVVVAGVTAVLGGVRLQRRVTLPAEVAAGVLAVLAIVLTLAGSARLELTSVALAAAGVIALANAPRPGRWWLGVVGPVLLLGALWLFLGWMRVSAPEPYTTVPALAALAAGWELRRRRPTTGTWVSYGAPLALLLAPGLVATLIGDGALWRVALLGTAGLAVTLVGAWWRLQAPLLIGAVSLLPLAAKTPGPPLWDMVLALPNWIPLGAVGILLVYAGARYERHIRRLRALGQRIRDMD